MRRLNDPAFTERASWRRFRDLLLEWVSGDEDKAELLWERYVKNLARRMSETEAERVAVTQGTVAILDELHARERGWIMDPSTGKWFRH